jgi:hypothetical protein
MSNDEIGELIFRTVQQKFPGASRVSVMYRLKVGLAPSMTISDAEVCRLAKEYGYRSPYPLASYDSLANYEALCNSLR